MNSLFILFSAIRSAIFGSSAPYLSAKNIWVGNYKVMDIVPATAANSYVVSLLDKDTKKILEFKTVSNEAGDIKISVIDMSLSDVPKISLSLMIGVEFSVIRTEVNQGRKHLFAKW